MFWKPFVTHLCVLKYSSVAKKFSLVFSRVHHQFMFSKLICFNAVCRFCQMVSSCWVFVETFHYGFYESKYLSFNGKKKGFQLNFKEFNIILGIVVQIGKVVCFCILVLKWRIMNVLAKNHINYMIFVISKCCNVYRCIYFRFSLQNSSQSLFLTTFL